MFRWEDQWKLSIIRRAYQRVKLLSHISMQSVVRFCSKQRIKDRSSRMRDCGLVKLSSVGRTRSHRYRWFVNKRSTERFIPSYVFMRGFLDECWLEERNAVTAARYSTWWTASRKSSIQPGEANERSQQQQRDRVCRGFSTTGSNTRLPPLCRGYPAEWTTRLLAIHNYE